MGNLAGRSWGGSRAATPDERRVAQTAPLKHEPAPILAWQRARTRRSPSTYDSRPATTALPVAMAGLASYPSKLTSVWKTRANSCASLGYDASLLRAVCRVFTLRPSQLRRTAKRNHRRTTVSQLHAGSITVVQRFRSDLGLYNHPWSD